MRNTMVQINQSTQLSTYDTLKAIITSNSTFNKLTIFNFEPSKSEHRLPNIQIFIPETSQDEKTLGKNPMYSKNFSINIVMQIGFQFKDDVITYINTLIKSIEEDITMEALGYELDSINNDMPYLSRNQDNMYNTSYYEVTFSLEYKGSL